jgi:hypothetical protein
VSIGSHLLRRSSRNRRSTLKELLRRCHISCGTQHRVRQITVLIDGVVQITPLALHFQIGLIHVSAWADFAVASTTELLCEQLGKTAFPFPDRFLREDKTTQQKPLGPVPQAQLIAEAAEQDWKDDVGGKLERVKGSAGSLLELAPAPATAKSVVA